MTAELIYKEDAINALKGVIARTELYGVSIEAILKTLPPVEAEPVVHAHWEYIGADKRGRGGVFQCSAKGCCRPIKSNFCPDCGARMDEVVFKPTPLIRLDLGGRINKRLRQMGVNTVEELEAMNKHTLHNIPGLGRKSIEIIESELRIWNLEKEKR